MRHVGIVQPCVSRSQAAPRIARASILALTSASRSRASIGLARAALATGTPASRSRTSLSPLRTALTVSVCAPALVFAACGAPDGPRPIEGDLQAPATATSPAGIEGARPADLDAAARARLAAVRDEMLRAGKCTDDCLRELRTLFESFPDSEDVRIALNNALVQRRDWNGLAQLYEGRADRTARENAYLGTVYIQLGRHADAAALLVPLSDATPADAELAYNAAYALHHMGDIEAAANRLDAGWERYRADGDVHAMTLRALTHVAAGEPERAVEILDEVVAVDPEYFPAHFALGSAHAALGDEPAAEAAFRRVAEIHASTEADTARRLRLSAQAEALKAAWAAKDYAEAERLVDAMLPQVDEPDLRRTILEFAAAIYEATGRSEAAREALIEAGAIEVGGEESP